MTRSQQNEQYAAALMEMVEPSEERALKASAGTPSTPSPWLVEAFGGFGESAAGVAVNEMSAMSVSAVFACVRNLAEDEAKLPLITYRRLQPRGKERATDHPLYALLHDSPNEEMTAFDFRQAMMVGAVMWGKGCAEIERTRGGIPIGLWPIEPWRIQPKRDPSTKRLYYEVDGKDRLDINDVLHIKGLSGDGIMGYMMAHVGRDSFGLGIAAQRFAAKYFGTGSRPSGYLTTEKKLDEPGRERLRAQWQQTYGGLENAHKTPVLEEKTMWNKVSSEPEEAQLLETRQFTVEDVARWFRMPPHKIGHLMRAAGWSTLEATNTDYIIDTLMPWFVRVEQEVKRKLIAREPEIFVEHLIDGMLRGDSQARAAFYKAMREMGVYNADDIAEMENRNPLPNGQGQAYLVPVNMTTLDRMIAGEVENPNKPAGEEEGEPRDLSAVRAKVAKAHTGILADAAARVIRKEAAAMRKAAKKGGDELRSAVESFYKDHAQYVSEVMGPPIRGYIAAMEALGADAAIDVTTFSAAHVAESRALLGSIEPSGVEICVSQWESTRPGAIADSLTGDKKP